MSESESEDDAVGTREVAHRLFAAEYDDADYSYKEGEEERAPTYVVTPSGAKANRIFFVGVLTEVEDVNEDMLRARVVDPTGAFVVYAGQYQPDARTFFERADPPEFVAVSGKARTFKPEDGDRVFTSVRPESVNAVDADTRDRWVVDAAERTLQRVGAMAAALDAGADEDPTAAGFESTDGIALALEHYGTTPAYLSALRDLATDALELVAGDRDEVRPLSVDPDDPSPADLDALLGAPPDGPVSVPAADAGAGSAPGADAGTATGTDAGAASDADAETDSGEAAVAAAPGGSESEAATADTDTATADADTGTGIETGVDGEADGSDDAAGETTATDAGVESSTTDETDAGGDTLGDFEPGGLSGGDADAEADEGTGADTDAGVDGDGDDVEVEGAPDEMYELDEEERREVEEEYGTEFSTGTEVDPAGEAGIETPETDAGAEPAEPDVDEEEAVEAGDAAVDAPETDDGIAADTGIDADAGADATETAADEPGTETDDEASVDLEEVDLSELVVDRMEEIDDGDGAEREKLVAAVVDETGADPADVEDALQDALMSGQCYEPTDGRLKPI